MYQVLLEAYALPTASVVTEIPTNLHLSRNGDH